MISHAQALALLRENTRRYTLRTIGWAEWDREVERILDLRFPSATSPHSAQLDALSELSHAMSTSTQLGSPLPAGVHSQGRGQVDAGGQDAP